MSVVFDNVPAQVLDRDWFWLFGPHFKASLVLSGFTPASSLVVLPEFGGSLVGPQMGLTGKDPTDGIAHSNEVTFYEVGVANVGGVLVWLETTGELIYFGDFAPVTPGDRPLTVSFPDGLFRV